MTNRLRRNDAWDSHVGLMDVVEELINPHRACPFAIAVQHDREKQAEGKKNLTFNLKSSDPVPCIYCDGTLEYMDAIGCTKLPKDFLKRKIIQNLEKLQKGEYCN